MTVFLTNSTTQTVVFFYRDQNNLLQHVRILSGRQVELCRGWKPSEHAKMIKQLEDFGAHDAAEAHGKIKKFSGLLYRLDGVISADEIVLGNGAVKDMQNERSVEATMRGALAADIAVNPRGGRRRRSRVTEVSVEQVVPPGERPTGDEVSFSLAVDAENGRDDPKARRLAGLAPA